MTDAQTEMPQTIAAAAAALRAGRLTSVDLVEAAIRRADAVDGRLGAYVTRFDDQARAAARVADRERGDGLDRGPLQGVPIAVKDLLTTQEGPTTAQSEAMVEQGPDHRDAAVVRHLRDAGAIIIGKTTLSEFACGFPDPDKRFPVPANPWDLTRWAGGSSAGSASGVAAGLFPAAVGTDTGGSVRIPAGFCGVTGLRTSPGLLDAEGCFPLAWSFDSIGPIAHTAQDCRLLLEAMGASLAPASAFTPRAGLADLRIGVDTLAAATPVTDPGQPEALTAALDALSDAGAQIVEAPLPLYGEVVAANYVIMLSEALAVHLPGLQARWHDYGRSTRTLLAGALGYTGADYVQAHRVRDHAARVVARTFADLDVHITPMATVGAPTLAALLGDDLGDVFGSLHTPYWATVGHPALSVPIGLTDAGMPVAMQVAGRPGDDGRVLDVGSWFQAVTECHLARPPL